MLSNVELSSLKKSLAGELSALKEGIDNLFIKNVALHEKKVSFVQRLFLTYRPISWLGWVVSSLFYFWLLFTSFGLLGLALDEKDEFSTRAFKNSLNDSDTIVGISVFILITLLIRYLALIQHKLKLSRQKSTK